MPQAPDIEAGVARFQDADRRAKAGPIGRLVVGADAVILRVARGDAEKSIVGGEEFGVRAHAELAGGARGEADQSGMTIDLNKILTHVGSINLHGAGAVRIKRMGHGRSACATVGQGRSGTGEESLNLGVIDSLRDFPALKAITHMSGDLFGEVILQHEGVARPLLAEEIISGVENEVGGRAGVVLGAGGGRERRRTGGRSESVFTGQQRCAKKTRRGQAPVSGNAEAVIAEAVDDTELVRYADGGGEIAGQRNAVRQRTAGQSEIPHAIAGDQAVKQLSGGRIAGFGVRIIKASGHIHAPEIVALEAELFRGKRVSRAAKAVIAEITIAGRVGEPSHQQRRIARLSRSRVEGNAQTHGNPASQGKARYAENIALRGAGKICGGIALKVD